MPPRPVHTPNEIPPKQRVIHLLASIALIVYGIIGLVIDDLYLPARRGGIHLRGMPAWIMFAAMVCAACVMVSVIADHYDRRDNERHYRQFAFVFEVLGWSCFAVSLVWWFVTPK